MAENEFKPNDKKNKKGTTKVKSKIRQLSSLDVSEFLVSLMFILMSFCKTHRGWKKLQLLDRPKTSRMEILCKAAEKDCTQQCQGMWLHCAYEAVDNNIHPYVFTAALQDLMEHGQGKFRNIMIIAPVNLLAPYK